MRNKLALIIERKDQTLARFYNHSFHPPGSTERQRGKKNSHLQAVTQGSTKQRKRPIQFNAIAAFAPRDGVHQAAKFDVTKNVLIRIFDVNDQSHRPVKQSARKFHVIARNHHLRLARSQPMNHSPPLRKIGIKRVIQLRHGKVDFAGNFLQNGMTVCVERQALSANHRPGIGGALKNSAP